jgi:biotin carboxylase
LAQVRAFGVNFGVCHSEFILTAQGPVLVEINYRSIGDGREFMLDRMFDHQWFETILRLHRGDHLALPEAIGQHALVRYYVARQEGRLATASINQSHATPLGHSDYRSLRHAGDDIRLSYSNKDYLGILHVVADNEEALQQVLRSAEAQLHWEIAVEQTSMGGIA